MGYNGASLPIGVAYQPAIRHDNRTAENIQPLSLNSVCLFIDAAIKEYIIESGVKKSPTPPPVRVFPTIAPRKAA